MAASWYCKVFGEVMGPMSAQKLLEMAQTQKLQPKDLVRRDDSKWVPAHSVKGLFQPAEPKKPAEGRPAGNTVVAGATAAAPRVAAAPQKPAAVAAPVKSTAAVDTAADHVLGSPEPKDDDAEDSTTVLRGFVPGAFIGNYMIMEKLGEGGMGVVIKARHRRMDRVVALKVLHMEATKNPAVIKRFQQEAQAAARLSHPNIITAYDADEANGAHFLVMEFVEGTPLSTILDKQGPLPIRDAANYVLQAARGLAYAHGEGIIHRDIKPGNLFLDKTGVIKIMDMGLARVDTPHFPKADEATAAESLTHMGQMMGTFDYMAPEQAEDARNADQRSDIYSLGCTLFRLLTGRPPYYAETPIHKIIAHRDHAIPSLVEARKGCTKELNAIFHLMVAKRPDDRYPVMNEVVTDLGMYMNGGMVRGATLRRAQELIQREQSRTPGQKAPESAPISTGPQYFCKIMGEEIGPLTKEQLAEMKQKKQLQPDDMVREEDLDRWFPAAELPGLF
jgi:serine/threonine protein kinase